ncbi:MAG: hypothetical protein WD467_01790 [Candidatus Saccharimonadales bacterium]
MGSAHVVSTTDSRPTEAVLQQASRAVRANLRDQFRSWRDESRLDPCISLPDGLVVYLEEHRADQSQTVSDDHQLTKYGVGILDYQGCQTLLMVPAKRIVGAWSSVQTQFTANGLVIESWSPADLPGTIKDAFRVIDLDRIEPLFPTSW